MSEPEVRSSRPIYQGRIFTVTVDRVRLPHGPEVDLEVVHHPGSVVMICVPGPGRIVLVQQYRYCAGRDLWEIPAGSLAGDEDPEAGARRECHEEIGQVPETVLRLGALFPTPGYCDEEMVFFRVSGLSEPTTQAAVDEDEDIEVRTFTLREARDMVRCGEIIDMKTVVGLGMI